MSTECTAPLVKATVLFQPGAYVLQKDLLSRFAPRAGYREEPVQLALHLNQSAGQQRPQDKLLIFVIEDIIRRTRKFKR